MLLSMTGHGEAQAKAEDLAATVEIRTINSRYFKVSVRSSEIISWLEPRMERIIRDHIRRGTVQVNVRLDRTSSADDFGFNTTILESYREQLQSIQAPNQTNDQIPLQYLMQLPGVIQDRRSNHRDAETDWQTIKTALESALQGLQSMRAEEGKSMAADLLENCRIITVELDHITERVPHVVEGYRDRLVERLNKLLREHELQIEASDLIREVGIFAERADISEEIVRLQSHLEQFDAFMKMKESNGRKLDFLTQEMFREANTIGSKANDIQIAKHVIEIKAVIERIREMVQNVE